MLFFNPGKRVTMNEFFYCILYESVYSIFQFANPNTYDNAEYVGLGDELLGSDFKLRVF